MLDIFLTRDYQDLRRNPFSERVYVVSDCDAEPENGFLRSWCVSPNYDKGLNRHRLPLPKIPSSCIYHVNPSVVMINESQNDGRHDDQCEYRISARQENVPIIV